MNSLARQHVYDSHYTWRPYYKVFVIYLPYKYLFYTALIISFAMVANVNEKISVTEEVLTQ